MVYKISRLSSLLSFLTSPSPLIGKKESLQQDKSTKIANNRSGFLLNLMIFATLAYFPYNILAMADILVDKLGQNKPTTFLYTKHNISLSSQQKFRDVVVIMVVVGWKLPRELCLFWILVPFPPRKLLCIQLERQNMNIWRPGKLPEKNTPLPIIEDDGDGDGILLS